MILRILIFVLCAAAIAWAATLLAGADGRTSAEAFGQRFDIHTGVAAGLIVALFVGAIFVTAWIKDAARFTASWRGRGDETRRGRGLDALARGLEAVAIGDAASAAKEARAAERHLEGTAVARLLSAQAAQLAGDDAGARDKFTAMLAAPDTEFLGLKGLYLQALKSGDAEAAKSHADRAWRLRPKAGWAFESVFALGLDRGAWGEMRAALGAAMKNRLIDEAKGRRAEAALLTADAYAGAAQDAKTALKDAERALNLAPSFAPAAALAARLHAAQGRRPKAAKIIEEAYAATPHRGLLKAHEELYAGDPAPKRADALERIAARAPASRESRLARARRALVIGEPRDALALLEPNLVERAAAEDFALTAEAVSAAYGAAAEEAARAWLKRAAEAPHDATPGADGVFHFTRSGWARLIREFMEHGRLAPPPLEEAPPGIPPEELKRLAPPEPPPTESPAAQSAATLRPQPPQDETSRVIAAAGAVS